MQPMAGSRVPMPRGGDATVWNCHTVVLLNNGGSSTSTNSWNSSTATMWCSHHAVLTSGCGMVCMPSVQQLARDVALRCGMTRQSLRSRECPLGSKSSCLFANFRADRDGRETALSRTSHCEFRACRATTRAVTARVVRPCLVHACFAAEAFRDASATLR